MKDYVNTNEREQLMYLIKCMDKTSLIVDEWYSRNNLHKDEKKNLKLSLTYGMKATTSILKRQNKSSHSAIVKTLDNCRLVLDYTDNLERLFKKKSSRLEDGYENNKDFFKMVELLLHYNCNGCTRNSGECDIYPEFEKHNIPEFSEAGHACNCKYSYKLK